jgi:hypothetical protein
MSVVELRTLSSLWVNWLLLANFVTGQNCHLRNCPRANYLTIAKLLNESFPASARLSRGYAQYEHHTALD